MEGLALTELVPIAIGIAMNPPAVVAVILMLSSAHPLRNAGPFVAGWMSGLFGVGGLVLLVGDVTQLWDVPTVVSSAIKLALGGLLLILALTQWRKHRSSAGDKEMPGWMQSLASMSGFKAFGAAAAFAAFNPKSLALNVAGVLVIADAPLTVAAEWLALAFFVALSSVTVAAPLLYYLVASERSDRVLESSKQWLIANNGAVTAIVLLVLGVMLAAGGAQALVSP
jgi:hypothetical protein